LAARAKKRSGAPDDGEILPSEICPRWRGAAIQAKTMMVPIGVPVGLQDLKGRNPTDIRAVSAIRGRDRERTHHHPSRFSHNSAPGRLAIDGDNVAQNRGRPKFGSPAEV
jgi:hypothetical protein